jgi:hypothetical protein
MITTLEVILTFPRLARGFRPSNVTRNPFIATFERPDKFFVLHFSSSRSALRASRDDEEFFRIARARRMI